MSPDDITNRLSRLEITQEGGESATETTDAFVEPTEQHCEGCNQDGTEQVCGRIIAGVGGVGESPTHTNSVMNGDFCNEALDVVQRVEDSFVIGDNQGEDNVEEAEGEGVEMSAISDCMSELTLETSATTNDIKDLHVDGGMVVAASKFCNNMTDDDGGGGSYEHDCDDEDADEEKTDFVSVMLPETSSVNCCVPVDEKQHECNVGAVVLASDCCSCNSVDDEQLHEGNAGAMELTSDCCSGNIVDDAQLCDCDAGAMVLASDCCSCNSVDDEQLHEGSAGAMVLTSDYCGGNSIDDEQLRGGSTGTMALTSDSCLGNSVDDVSNQHDLDDDNNNDGDESIDAVSNAAAAADDIDSSSLVAEGMFYVYC